MSESVMKDKQQEQDLHTGKAGCQPQLPLNK